MQSETLQFASEQIKLEKKVALVSITEKGKGAPGSVGQIMAVLADGTSKGTVGGGTTEFQLIQRAKETIAKGVKSEDFSYDLSKSGMLCGGSIKGNILVIGGGNKLIVFGAGHVAQKIAPLAVGLGFQVIVVDDREDLKAYFQNVHYLPKKAAQLAEDELEIDADTYIVIATRGHSQDFESLCHCLPFESAYLGMIGSVGKVKSLYEKAIAKGFSKEALEKVYAPVGLYIADGSPGEIAVAILAEVLKVKNNGKLTHMKLDMQMLEN